MAFTEASSTTFNSASPCSDPAPDGACGGMPVAQAHAKPDPLGPSDPLGTSGSKRSVPPARTPSRGRGAEEAEGEGEGEAGLLGLAA